MGQPVDLLLPGPVPVPSDGSACGTGDMDPSLVPPAGDPHSYARRRNGELFPIEATVSPTQVQGRPVSTMIVRDVSRRLLDEQALNESRERLAVFVATAFEGIVISEQGVILDCNEQFAEMLGRSVESLKGELIERLVVDDDRERVAANLRTGREGIAEHELLRPDGSRIIVQTNAKMVPAGSPNGRRYTVVRDITEHKRAEQALIEADRRKDEFLAMLAHELRNPITPIRNAAHVLGRLDVDDARVRWAQEVIERQAQHLTRLVDDLLDVSRIVRGKVELKKEHVELSTVVQQALEMARPLIESMNHTLEVQLPEQAIYLEGDPVRLAQIVLNLLDNAAKYTPNGGVVRIDGRVAGANVEIKVSDNGIGIAADLLPRIFDVNILSR
jgi:PAS domain S-box-containing protein